MLHLFFNVAVVAMIVFLAMQLYWAFLHDVELKAEEYSKGVHVSRDPLSLLRLCLYLPLSLCLLSLIKCSQTSSKRSRFARETTSTTTASPPSVFRPWLPPATCGSAACSVTRASWAGAWASPRAAANLTVCEQWAHLRRDGW